MTQVVARTRWAGLNRDGYPRLVLEVAGERVSSCVGGGYDMVGTVFGSWIEKEFASLLLKVDKPMLGLKFVDQGYDPGTAVVGGKTIEEREALGEVMCLDRYQAALGASSDLPGERHTVPDIDGAYGFEAVCSIMEVIGGKIERVRGGAEGVPGDVAGLTSCGGMVLWHCT